VDVVLDVPGGSTVSGTGIIVYTWNGGDNQLWAIQPAPNNPGFSVFRNKKSQLLLTVPPVAGGQVIQVADNGQDTQLWRFVPTGDGLSNYVINKHSGLVLDVKGVNAWDGTPVIHYKQNNGANQQWYGGVPNVPG